MSYYKIGLGLAEPIFKKKLLGVGADPPPYREDSRNWKLWLGAALVATGLVVVATKAKSGISEKIWSGPASSRRRPEWWT